MKDYGEIEKALDNQRAEIAGLAAPLELESKLREALAKTKQTHGIKGTGHTRYSQKSFRLHKGLIAALITFVLMFAYSYDTLAYYGKKMIGYDNIVYGSIAALNEEGAGQEINKSCTFRNGVQLTLDGIMFDENELVAFYRIKSTDVKISELTLHLEIDGMKPLGYPASGGSGLTIDDHTQIWVQSFPSPKFYEKWLSLKINLITAKKTELGQIDFTLDRSKAMKRVFRQEIGQEVVLDGLKVNFLSLTASRLNTTIQGTMKPLLDPSRDFSEYSWENHPSLKFDFYIDDKYYSTAYAGVDFRNKAEFSSETLGLPAGFQGMEIRNIRLTRMRMVDKTVNIALETKDLVVTPDLIIKEVSQDKETTSIRIASKGIPIMGLLIEGEQVQGENGNSTDLAESEQPVERVYQYQGIGENMKLMVKGINYARYAEQSIPIIM